MNINGFITYMKENKKSERCVREYARCAQEFNEFLSTTAANKTIDNANPGDIEAFSKAGIRNARQLLNAGLTRSERKKLSRETGLSEKTVLEFVKLSDLARIGGLKKIRGRLYYDAGFDTIQRISEHTPDDIRQRLKSYIDKTGFNGIPPTPKEAMRAVSMARHLKRIVEY